MQFSLRRTDENLLEILVDLQWEKLCGSLFHETYAKVACRQLGYHSGDFIEFVNQIDEAGW